MALFHETHRDHPGMASRYIRFLTAACFGCSLLLGGMSSSAFAQQAEHILLFVLEGIKSTTIQGGQTPHLHNLAKEGVVSWSAQSITPPLTVSAMASLLTGLPRRKTSGGSQLGKI